MQRIQMWHKVWSCCILELFREETLFECAKSQDLITKSQWLMITDSVIAAAINLTKVFRSHRDLLVRIHCIFPNIIQCKQIYSMIQATGFLQFFSFKWELNTSVSCLSVLVSHKYTKHLDSTVCMSIRYSLFFCRHRRLRSPHFIHT